MRTLLSIIAVLAFGYWALIYIENPMHLHDADKRIFYNEGLALGLTFAISDRFVFKITQYWNHVCNIILFSQALGMIYLSIYALKFQGLQHSGLNSYKTTFLVFNFICVILSVSILIGCTKRGIFKKP